MNEESTSRLPIRPSHNGLKAVVFAALCLAAAGGLLAKLLKNDAPPAPSNFRPADYDSVEFRGVVSRVDSTFAGGWKTAGLQPAPQAPPLTLARRLSLGLTGTIPSLPEIRSLEQQSSDQVVQWWLSRLFEDRRYSDYVAERLARVYVGVENGPFLIYRRHRMVEWLSDEVAANRPYDQITRQLIGAKGIWTTKPEVNFITATVDQNDKNKGPDEVKLAARISRAFLGVRLDCVQCHDDFLGDRWKQKDFHQIAAFFAPAEMSLTGVQENKKNEYDFRYHGKAETERVNPTVPFHPELLPAKGELRDRLAQWVTHRDNRSFARTTVNRVWALMFNRPLVEPIDSIPLDGPFPAGMEVLADDLIAHGHDLQRLIRVIAATRVFQMDSRAADPSHPVTEEQEKCYASFPLSRLRPEQVAGSVLQAASIQTLDADAHVVFQISRSIQEKNFVKSYGDIGEDEFNQRSGTIPQRLLMMNGNMVKDRTKSNPFVNASSRISLLSPDDNVAVDTSYLCLLTRRPTPAEKEYFLKQLAGSKGVVRERAMEDLYWTLMNSTEFSWNH
ncbi:MAG TPA: DUF1549 domain-containing protein [Roseimicrobium sp.]|nr:DUF1549 domain-containing protein [Roseimicrobium sp.]